MKWPSFRRTSRSTQSGCPGTGSNSQTDAQEVKNARAQEVKHPLKVSPRQMTRSPTKDTLVSGSTTFGSVTSSTSTHSLTGLTPRDSAIDPRCRSSTLALTEKRLAQKFEAARLASLEEAGRSSTKTRGQPSQKDTSGHWDNPSSSWGHWDNTTRERKGAPDHIGDTAVNEDVFSTLLCDAWAAKTDLNEIEESKLSQFCWTGNVFSCAVLKV